MATPSEKLAESLEVLHALQNEGVVAIRSADLTRTHRERLCKNRFLQEVIKGWYVPTRPDETAGESTAWYASFWSFCSEYLNHRFGSDWCLSPEQSLSLRLFVASFLSHSGTSIIDYYYLLLKCPVLLDHYRGRGH